MKTPVIIICVVLAASCSSPSRLIDCHQAALTETKFKECTINGVIEQEGADFRVVPFEYGETEPRLVIVSDSDNWPMEERFGIAGTISYCGPYSKHLGGFVVIDVPFNSAGTYKGEVIFNTC